MKKVYIATHGCQMNEYDSARMADILLEMGVDKTDQPEQADILLLNTCSIREKAQEKVFSEVGRWRKLKNKKKGMIIGVGGCVASQEGWDIIRRAPYVDIVFGPQTLHRLPELIASVEKNRQPAVDVSFPEIEKFDRLPTPKAEGVSAYVSIMEGCSKYCSFCIVPYTRGEEISRDFDSVIAECVALAEQGVREITLLGQNVNDYRGLMDNGDLADLALLIHYIAVIDGIDRIRFTTSHPAAFSQNLIDAYAETPALANHLHLPVQSGSDRVLAAMKRNYTTLEFKSKIRKLRQARPDISISSDFIVGFPGETDADFDKTLQLVEEIGFDQSYSFIYSPRPGTPAARLPDDTPMAVKKERLQRLQHLLNNNAQRISRDMLGSRQQVLVTGHAKKQPAQLSGRTENNRVVNFDGDQQLIGQFVEVEITEALPNSLRGTVLNPSPA
ncbi:MAG: tRNA (N6-isopentenyl adenosine(37)-C2)-methylthiotransferase MiaB [Pseudomonadota bacterium]